MPASNFELSSLVVGQIKELLHSFNLPMIPVYTDDTLLQNDKAYIKGDKVVRYKNGEFKTITPYKFGVEIVNLTKNFQIRSSIYDSYTHEYLGNYLRFLRDYKNIDLMNMYNCFFGDELVNTYIQTSGMLIDTTDNVNRYYLIPVKLNKYYTVAIDAVAPYETALVIHNNTLVDTDECKELINTTHTKIAGSNFKRPYLISTFVDSKFLTKEHDIKLLIKIPRKLKTSIVILEGDYKVQAESIDGVLPQKANNCKNSLLAINNTLSYPFADRLVEYITGNIICPLDSVPEDIERIQTQLYLPKLKYIKGLTGIWTDDLKNDILERCKGKDTTLGNGVRQSNTILVIDDDGAVEHKKYDYTFLDTKYDINGYVDKDTEYLLNVDYKDYIRSLE